MQEALDQNKHKGVDSEASLTVFSCDGTRTACVATR